MVFFFERSIIVDNKNIFFVGDFLAPTFFAQPRSGWARISIERNDSRKKIPEKNRRFDKQIIDIGNLVTEFNGMGRQSFA